MQQGTRLRFHDFFACWETLLEGRHDILVLNIALGKQETQWAKKAEKVQ